MARGDKFYFDNFSVCAAIAKRAAEHLALCLEEYSVDRLDEMLREMHSLEHSADMKKHEMSKALAKAFVTPVDREDLDMLSRQLDNVPDLLEEVLQKLYIFRVTEIEQGAVEYAKKLVSACDILCQIMEELESFKRSQKIHGLIVSANDIEEECDKLYLKSMRGLTESASDALTKLSWYQIYDCLEACADACEHVSDCVESIIMKNT